MKYSFVNGDHAADVDDAWYRIKAPANAAAVGDIRIFAASSRTTTYIAIGKQR